MRGARTWWAGLVAAATGTVAGAVLLHPGADAATGSPPQGEPSWSIVRQGVEVALARECTGLGSSSAVLEFRDGTAQDTVRKEPGASRAPDVTCALSTSADRTLYAWRKQVEDGDVRSARGLVEVVLRAYDGSVVQRWQLARAWPSQYLVTFDRTVLTLTHERAELVP